MKTLLFLSLFYLSANALPFADQLTNDFNGTNWVVLAAGGGASLEYAIEADVYHAYQVARARGVPEKNIIVMNLDVIANNKNNPTPGVVVSEPNGTDVYHGVPKDYVHDDVTPLNFLAILRGDPVLARSNKKVVKSGPDDHIFVYFMDHGAPDFVMFPKGRLYGEELNNQLIEMHKDKKFAKLVFYIEACESGSMFNKLLPNDINVYAVTSSGPTENSYACLYDKFRNEYVAGYFNHYWMEHAEKHDLTKETLDDQFEYVQNKTATIYEDPQTKLKWNQHAQHYGDLSIAKLPVSLFFGKDNPKINDNDMEEESSTEVLEFVNTRDVAIHLAQKRIESTDNINEKRIYIKELERILNGRQLVDKHFEEYVNSIRDLVTIDANSILNDKHELNNRQCYRKFVDTFDEQCININENTYTLQKMMTFVNICEHLTDSMAAEQAINRLTIYCRQYVKSANIINVV